MGTDKKGSVHLVRQRLNEHTIYEHPVRYLLKRMLVGMTLSWLAILMIFYFKGIL